MSGIDEKIEKFVAGQSTPAHAAIVAAVDLGIDALLDHHLGAFVREHPEYSDEAHLELRSDMAEMLAKHAAAAMLSSFGPGAVPMEELVALSDRHATEYIGDLGRTLLEILNRMRTSS